MPLKMLLFALALLLTYGTAGIIPDVPGPIGGDTGDAGKIQRLLGQGFADPERFIQSGSCRALAEYLESHHGITDTIVTAAMLENMLLQARARHEYPMVVFGEIARFASIGNSTDHSACSGLLEAGGIAARRLFNPELAFSIINLAAAEGCPAAADTMARIIAYSKNDMEIARLLAQSPSPQELRTYIEKGDEAADRYPRSSLNAELCRRIGDMCLSLNDYAGMEKWYLRAIAADPALEKNTTIGFRLQNYAPVKLKNNWLTAAFACFGCALVLLVIRAAKNRRCFDIPFFLSRSAAALVVYGAAIWIACSIDTRFASRTLLHLTDEQATALHIDKPVIPLNFLASTYLKTAVQILALGFLPILFALFYVSFKKPPSRWLLAGIILFTASAIWIHFYFTRIYSLANPPRGYIMHGRVYLRDEPEELLVKHPLRALRANPDLLKSDNEDLHEFIEKHFPAGFPEKPR